MTNSSHRQRLARAVADSTGLNYQRALQAVADAAAAGQLPPSLHADQLHLARAAVIGYLADSDDPAARRHRLSFTLSQLRDRARVFRRDANQPTFTLATHRPGVVLQGSAEDIAAALSLTVEESRITTVLDIQFEAGEKKRSVASKIVAAAEERFGTQLNEDATIGALFWIHQRQHPFHLLMRDPDLLTRAAANHLNTLLKAPYCGLPIFVGQNAPAHFETPHEPGSRAPSRLGRYFLVLDITGAAAVAMHRS